MHLIIKIDSICDDYMVDDYISLRTIRKINEGKYGSVYLTNYEDYVIKILKNIPSNHFLTEIEAFNKLKKITNYPPNLVKYIACGKVSECDKVNYKNKNVLVMKKYNEFFTLYPELKSIPLIFYNDYKPFIIKFIYKLLNINKFIEDELNAVNIDIKLHNIMTDNKDIIVIDLGMLIEYKKEGVIIENLSNYIIWPYGKTNLKYIANYSVAIVAMYILFKNKKYDIELDNNIKIILKILLARKYDTTYAIDFMKEHFPNELK